jgi:dimethylglycine dehydrogenase
MELLKLERDESHLPFAAHPVIQGESSVGIVTSGAFGHRTGQSLALAYLTPRAGPEDFSVEIVGKRIAARILSRCPYDSSNKKLRDL